jgi:hypothetical protein
MRMTRLAVVTTMMLALTASAGAVQRQGDQADTARMFAVQRWVAAVTEHAPGVIDMPLVHVLRMSADDRKSLTEGLQIYFRALLGKGVTTTTTEQKRVAELGADKARNPGPNAFLKTAAVLHSDAALAGPVEILRSPANQSASGPKLVWANDGEFGGAVVADWNWPFARSLIDMLYPSPVGDPFVAQWYHATSATLLRFGHYGEVNPHLQRALSLIPDDPLIAFDRACYYEGLTLPRARQVLEDPRTEQVLTPTGPNSTGARAPTVTPAAQRRGNTDVERLRAEAEAERALRRVLALDDGAAEARVRLGRMIDGRGRHEEALEQFTAALIGQVDPVTAYYAHLFAARSTRALGRLDQAAAHVRDALALFPDAQSGLVAQSQLALFSGDASLALAPIRHLSTLNHDQRQDPWWQYPMGAGRDADGLLKQLWASTKK